MKQVCRTLCTGLLLLLCLLLACCGKSTDEPSDSSTDSTVQTVSDPEESSASPDPSVPASPDPLEAVLRCVTATEEASSFSAALEGTCRTQVLLLSYEQQIRSARTVTPEAMFSQSVSISSLVRVGVQQYFQGDTVLVRSGEVHALDEVDWAKEATSVTPEDYRAAYGNTPRGLSNYLLDADTILSARLESATEEEITVVCELDPAASTVEYAKQVKTTGGLDELPVFSSVTLTVTMDGAYRPLRVRYEEVYQISIAILGNTTCKTDYTETFSSFDAVSAVPEQAFFASFLSQSTAEYPKISSGYSFLLSLFGDTASYDLKLEAAGQTFPLQLSLDAASGAILLHGETADLLYEGDRYYLLAGNNRVFVDAEALNRRIRSLTRGSLPDFQGQGGEGASPFSGFTVQPENGNLVMKAGDEKDYFRAVIGMRTLSLLSAEIRLSGSGTPVRLSLEQSSNAVPIPPLSGCTDVTPALPALSFLDLLPSLRDGETLSARLRAEGSAVYTADLSLSLQDQLAFSLLPDADSLPIAVYGQGEAFSAVWEELSLTGAYEDFSSLLTLFSGGQASYQTGNAFSSLSRLLAEPGRLTLYVTDDVSLMLTGSEIRLSGEGGTLYLSDFGTSSQKVPSAPQTKNRLSVSALSSFLSGSVYPALLGEKAVTCDLSLTSGGEDAHVRLRVRPDGSAIGLTTIWNGAETDLLYTNGTLFLSHPVIRAFLPVDRLPAMAEPFLPLPGGTQFPSSAGEASVSCDGEKLTLSFGETSITLEKDRFLVSGEGWTALGTEIAPFEGPDSFSPPDPADCVDLEALSKRVTPLLAQKGFSFTGRYKDSDVSAVFSDLTLTLNGNGGLDDVSVAFLPYGADKTIRLFYDGSCLFLDIGEMRLFCLAGALFPDGTDFVSGEGTALTGEALSGLRTVMFRDDILKIETEDALLRLTWEEEALSEIFYSSGERTLSLRCIPFAPIPTPPLELYTDLTPFADLLSAIGMESGCFTLGDLRDFFLSVFTSGIRFSGNLPLHN